LKIKDGDVMNKAFYSTATLPGGDAGGKDILLQKEMTGDGEGWPCKVVICRPDLLTGFAISSNKSCARGYGRSGDKQPPFSNPLWKYKTQPNTLSSDQIMLPWTPSTQ